MKIIVYEGTFDPPHIGHYWLLQQAIEATKANKAYVVVNSNEGARIGSNKAQISTQHIRYKMCQLTFDQLNIECKKAELIYTYDILNSIDSMYEPGIAKIYWLCGNDWSTGGLEKFKYYKEIKNNYGFLFPNGLCYYLLSKVNKEFLYDSRAINLNIRSTTIRERIKNNLLITGLVSRDVENTIRRNNLYKTD